MKRQVKAFQSRGSLPPGTVIKVIKSGTGVAAGSTVVRAASGVGSVTQGVPGGPTVIRAVRPLGTAVGSVGGLNKNPVLLQGNQIKVSNQSLCFKFSKLIVRFLAAKR